VASSFWAGVVPAPQIRPHLLREEGEVIVDEVSHHWVSYLRPALFACLGLALGVGSAFVHVDVAWVFLLAGVAVLLYAGIRALSVHMDRFVVTNMRVFRVQGVFSQSLATMPLTRILDITVEKPFIGRLLGYGNFTFESAAQAQGLRQIHNVPHPDQRDLTIQRVVQRAGLRGRRVN
jgi:membrane protein YdbS with pleckstrin-like domain